MSESPRMFGKSADSWAPPGPRKPGARGCIAHFTVKGYEAQRVFLFRSQAGSWLTGTLAWESGGSGFRFLLLSFRAQSRTWVYSRLANAAHRPCAAC